MRIFFFRLSQLTVTIGGPIFKKTLAVLVFITICFSGCHASLPMDNPSVSLSTADNGIFDENDLLAIMDEAGEMLLNGKVTIKDPSYFVRHFFNWNRQILVNCYSTEDNVITIDYSSDLADRQTVLQYGIFLHLVTTRYPDCVCEVDYAYDAINMNRNYWPVMFFYPDYQKTEYASVLDYYKAIESGVLPKAENSFYIFFNDSFRFYEYWDTTMYGGISRYSYSFEYYEKYLGN